MMSKFLSLAVLCCLLLTGCGGGGGGVAAIKPVLQVAPTAASVIPGGTQQFQFLVTGATNKAVNWRVQEGNGGSITTGGLYTAPTNPGSFHVVVTTQADGSVQKIIPARWQ